MASSMKVFFRFRNSLKPAGHKPSDYSYGTNMGVGIGPPSHVLRLKRYSWCSKFNNPHKRWRSGYYVVMGMFHRTVQIGFEI